MQRNPSCSVLFKYLRTLYLSSKAQLFRFCHREELDLVIGMLDTSVGTPSPLGRQRQLEHGVSETSAAHARGEGGRAPA